MSSNVRASVSPATTCAAAARRSFMTVGFPYAPWHFLYFFPLPHQQGSLRPSLGSSRRTVFTGASSPPVRAGVGAAPLRGGAAVAAADDEPPLSVMGVGRRGAG